MIRKNLKVVMAQLPLIDGDPERNMRLAEAAAADAWREGADILCLPEAADFGWLHQHSRRDAYPIPGRYTDFLAEVAKRHSIWVSGGCLERDGDQVYNSAVIIDREGRIVLRHRKISTLPELTSHLYDAGSVEGVGVVDTEFGRIGLTICADNFDLAVPQRAADLGAWLLIAPHGFAAPVEGMKENAQKFQAHICEIAAKTGMWVVGTNVVLARVAGGAWAGQMHCGCSIVARPDGSSAATGRFKEPDLILCDIPVRSGGM